MHNKNYELAYSSRTLAEFIITAASLFPQHTITPRHAVTACFPKTTDTRYIVVISWCDCVLVRCFHIWLTA